MQLITTPCNILEGCPTLEYSIHGEITYMHEEVLGRMWKDIWCYSEGVVRWLHHNDVILGGSSRHKEQ